MKLTVAVAVSGLLAGVSAQGLADGLPKCAQNCAMDSIPEDCGLDPECICKAKSFIDSITCCVVDACSDDDQKKTIEYAHKICKPAGVDDLPDSAVCKDDSEEETDGVIHGTAVSTGADEATDGVVHGTAVSTGVGEPTDGVVHGTAVSTGTGGGPTKATMPPNVSGTGTAPTGTATGTATQSGEGPASTTGGAAGLVAQNGAVAAAAAAFAFFI